MKSGNKYLAKPINVMNYHWFISYFIGPNPKHGVIVRHDVITATDRCTKDSAIGLAADIGSAALPAAKKQWRGRR